MHRPPFRADHIGSLLRPARLRHAFRAFSAGELDNEHFAAAQDAAILDAINLQQDAGFAVVTDGEFRRGSYWSRFVERIEGLGVAEALFRFHDEQGEELAFTAPRVTGRLTRREPIALDEFIFLRDNAAALPKVTFPAPSTMHFRRGADASPGLHSNPREFCVTWQQIRAWCSASSAPKLPRSKLLTICLRGLMKPRFVDRDRLAVSPQCGFASTVAGNPVDEAAQRSKLSLTVRVANAAWT